MGAIIGLIFGIIAAFIASSKGFKSLRWILALGIVGFFTVIFMPSAQADGISTEEAERRASKANNVGAWMAWINVILGVIIGVIAIIAVNSY